MVCEQSVSSSKIDKFIEALHKKSADHLLFGTNTPVRISKGGAERVILDQPVRTDQLLKLLSPIVGDTSGLEVDGESEFFYDAPTGRVHLRTMRTGDRMTAIISPSNGEAAPDDD